MSEQNGTWKIRVKPGGGTTGEGITVDWKMTPLDKVPGGYCFILEVREDGNTRPEGINGLPERILKSIITRAKTVVSKLTGKYKDQFAADTRSDRLLIVPR